MNERGISRHFNVKFYVVEIDPKSNALTLIKGPEMVQLRLQYKIKIHIKISFHKVA